LLVQYEMIKDAVNGKTFSFVPKNEYCWLIKIVSLNLMHAACTHDDVASLLFKKEQNYNNIKLRIPASGCL
jgi:hypothetical protein